MRTVILRAIAVITAALLIPATLGTPADAATAKITIRSLVDEVRIGRTFTLFGTVTPAVKGLVVSRQVYRQKTWKTTGSTRTNGKGDWKMVVTAPAWEEVLRLRVQVTARGKRITSPTVVVKAVRMLTPKSEPTADPGPEYLEPAPTTPTDPVFDWQDEIDRNAVSETPTVVIEALGKGNRILGADIARYQHPVSRLFPEGAPIDFKRMYQGGVRFLYIKASDGRDPGHNNAERWYAVDRAAAQEAGIYTGFYHYAYFPASTLATDIIADAQAQADKALWRLSSVGGYNQLDLPLALDIEEECVLRSVNGNCIRNVTKNAATLWTRTWLARIEERTGRQPIVYSSPSFLQNWLNRDPVLRQYPLWIAHYDRDPAIPSNFPGMKSDGTCFIHAWTLNNCRSQWAIWQYTSSGKATSFGIAGGNLDLNIYAGTSQDFLAFARGTWTPAPNDFLPFNETTTMTIRSAVFSLTTAPVVASVTVTRPTGLPVVSGGLSVTLLAGTGGIAPTPEQVATVRMTTTRTGVGSWEIRITGVPAGSWNLQVSFADSSRVHASSAGLLPVTLIPPVAPTIPDTATAVTTPTPSPEPTPSPAP